MRTSHNDEELFESALALPAAERSGFLARACGDDLDAYERLQSLLNAYDRAAHFVGQSGAQQFESTGDRIGDYRLLQALGEGGCGVVYLAEQTAPARRQVALKILKMGLETGLNNDLDLDCTLNLDVGLNVDLNSGTDAQVMARFEAEPRALARMDHMNIAKVFDVGVTRSGRPYFVMELVRGIRITDYCDRGRLSIPERVGLFMQVCEAIEHAHRRDIIHRDIKPSNVLVTLRKGAPVVKVIDFGIAKSAAHHSPDDMRDEVPRQILPMLLEQFIGTPTYVSPEQLQPGRAEVDARSDIYSLGVLLYELLTGCTPFEVEYSGQAGLLEWRRRVLEQKPPLPSRRVAALSLPEVMRTQEYRQTSQARLIWQLRSGLDCIVMRCLKMERAQRYQSAAALGADMQKCLNNERLRPDGPPRQPCLFNPESNQVRVHA